METYPGSTYLKASRRSLSTVMVIFVFVAICAPPSVFGRILPYNAILVHTNPYTGFLPASAATGGGRWGLEKGFPFMSTVRHGPAGAAEGPPAVVDVAGPDYGRTGGGRDEPSEPKGAERYGEMPGKAGGENTGGGPGLRAGSGSRLCGHSGRGPYKYILTRHNTTSPLSQACGRMG